MNKQCDEIEYKKVRIRLIVEYEIQVPKDWDKDMIEFHRNESSWCAGNALEELEELSEQDGRNGCMCDDFKCEYIEDVKGD